MPVGLDISTGTLTDQTARQPRAVGDVVITARLRSGRTRLAGLRQQGSAKALLPRHPGTDLQAVLLNTAGGITGGDRFHYTATAEAGAVLTLATQTAERGYRAHPGTRGEITTRLTAGPGARINWLAQETILFDHAALARRFNADLAPDATLLAVEPLVLGRAAMGETVHNLRFTDQWRIRRGGQLIFADAMRIMGDPATLLSGPATLGGNRAMASLLLVSPDAASALPGLRALMAATDMATTGTTSGATAGASLIRDGVLAARVVAADGFLLRRALTPLLTFLGGAPLPTVWTI